jgi:hypothetical protein
MALTREQLLKKQELKIEKVKLSTGDVYVRQMNGREKNRFELTLGHWEDYKEDGKDKNRYVRSLEDFRAKLAVHTVCDKNGVLLLTKEDIDTLSENMSGADLERIADAAQGLNAITELDRERMVKNSGGAPAAASSSTSA